jgi:hypothetical protein
MSAAAPCAAGVLTIAWPPAAGAQGYRIYVGSQSGVYERTIDAGTASKATVSGLEDERVYHIAVKAYDATGRTSAGFSPELACLPAPHIVSIEPPVLTAGRATSVTIEGANFDPEIQVRARDARLAVRSASPAGPGRISVLVEATPGGDGAMTLEAVSFTLINPCRKADVYFNAHPEAADSDGSGAVDQEDLALVRAAFGARRGESGYEPAADVDGDGAVDGRDVARVLAGLGSASPPAHPSTASAERVTVPAGPGTVLAEAASPAGPTSNFAQRSPAGASGEIR